MDTSHRIETREALCAFLRSYLCLSILTIASAFVVRIINADTNALSVICKLFTSTLPTQTARIKALLHSSLVKNATGPSAKPQTTIPAPRDIRSF